MASAGRMQTALASEATRRKSRQQEYEAEQGKLFTTLVFPEKLRALEETDSKRKPSSPKSPLAFVNRAFSAASPFTFFPTSARRATVDAVAPIKAESRRSPHRRNVSLDALDKVELLAPEETEELCSELEACQQQQAAPVPKPEVKRVYVSRPLVRRRFSVDDRPCVTIFSSEAPAKPTHVSPPPRLSAPLAPRLPPGNVKLREQRARDAADAPQRVLSFPNLDYDFEQDLNLKYWRDVLHNSPQLKALEKR